MWTGKGRSGIGDTNIQGTHDDWDGLSMNGRQYRNDITQECRNLSGADYWFARKADYPKQEPETWVNGKANVNAFRDTRSKPPKKLKKKRSVSDSIDLANRHYERMEKLSEALELEYISGQMEEERYLFLRAKQDGRLLRAWERMEKEQEQFKGSYYNVEDDRKEQSTKSLHHPKNEDNLFYSLNENNMFRKMYEKAVKLTLIWKELKKC